MGTTIEEQESFRAEIKVAKVVRRRSMPDSYGERNGLSPTDLGAEEREMTALVIRAPDIETLREKVKALIDLVDEDSI